MYNYLFRNWTSVNGGISIEDDHTWIGAYPLVPTEFEDYKYGSFEDTLPVNDTITNQKNGMYANFFSFAHIVFFCPLLVLLIRSTNLKEKYGCPHRSISYYDKNGQIINGSTIQSDDDKTGLLDKKGLFYGQTDKTTGLGVKLFGIEHFYGYLNLLTVGITLRSLVPYIQMKTVGHNINGDNYTSIPEAALNIVVDDGKTAHYLSKLKFYPDKFLPVGTSISDTYNIGTYFCNSVWAKKYTYPSLAIYGCDQFSEVPERGLFCPTDFTYGTETSKNTMFLRDAYVKVSGL